MKRSPMGLERPRSDIPQRDELPFGSGAELIQRIAESGGSRKLGFRYSPFSETELPLSPILGNRASGISYSRKLSKPRSYIYRDPTNNYGEQSIAG